MARLLFPPVTSSPTHPHAMGENNSFKGFVVKTACIVFKGLLVVCNPPPPPPPPPIPPKKLQITFKCCDQLITPFFQLMVGFILQTSRTNNKLAKSTFKFAYPRLTFSGGSQGQM